MDPTATINTFAATEDAIQTATSGTPLAAGNVITGGTPDSDPDGDSLTVTSITAPTVTETDAQLSITSITSQSAGSGEVARYQILTNTGTALLAVTSGGDVRLWTTAGDPFQGLGSGESAAINFNYTVSDGHGGTSSAATTITVNGSEDISNTLISTVVDGRQGNNSTPSTVTITFATAAHANFVNLSDVMHVSGLANVTVINGSGSFIDSLITSLALIKVQAAPMGRPTPWTSMPVHFRTMPEIPTLRSTLQISNPPVSPARPSTWRSVTWR